MPSTKETRQVLPEASEAPKPVREEDAALQELEDSEDTPGFEIGDDIVENASTHASGDEEGEESSETEDDYDSDDSDDEYTRNRIGKVPLKWYLDNHDHIGYDISGKKIARTVKTSEIDTLLRAAEDPDAWRTVTDIKNDREIKLSDTDLRIIQRIRKGFFPTGRGDGDEDEEFQVEYEDRIEDKIHPMRTRYLTKKSFMPDQDEARKVKRLIKLIRAGIIKPKEEKPAKEEEEVFDAWGDEDEEGEGRKLKGPAPIPAPKQALPTHSESYNPPDEYLFDDAEKAEWEAGDDSIRKQNYMPQKFACLRHVPFYRDFLKERFERCLDLYLCPRVVKKKMNVDPLSLLPQLPSPSDLRPFPTTVGVDFKGHHEKVTDSSFNATGELLATCAADGLRIWDTLSGCCLLQRMVEVEVDVSPLCVSWHPKYADILAVGTNNGTVELLRPQCVKASPAAEEDEESEDEDEEESAGPRRPTANADLLEPVEDGDWTAVSDAPGFEGLLIKADERADITKLTWHPKGWYLSHVAPNAVQVRSQCVIHNLRSQKTIRPFSKSKGGKIQASAFHPRKPQFYICTQKNVRLYDLKAQSLVRTYVSGAQHIMAISVFPGTGEHLTIVSQDRRLCWFDNELGNKPWKTWRYHKRVVRDVEFHPLAAGRLPLMATCSDDGSAHIFHAKVYNDAMSNPLVVPVKKLRPKDGGRILSCSWHPHQPWILLTMGDGRVQMWV
ncbi:Ribosome biogenesis protein BOP1, putative [Perkinsus marinus ATCC 50983]|uniref:Ribosome biogenesis protein BOP1 homolog n=2 Tax=Perkinsus marinus (strain ATCC 50983 / TXsc) TaxID=423536 RepID=C5LUC5_PERM5|nr:Ribosome biogenesis protein BOP1, putative [Perkinsus marinus ATCC 50983]EEQ99658.1 Ribosome biogenesis protein BOP1, putative [Perkinsus marinus ATCC 50983]|eukprot:XP_002766941.1 Ribosome biogenesis protein BOP1, putative [Perkinsus marinus ATCC 50983]